MFRFILSVADHQIANQYHKYISDMEVMAIARWIQQNSRLVERGERPIPFVKLRKILQRFICEMYVCPGSCIEIQRNVRRRFFRGTRLLKTKVHYDGEGREVEKNTINKIRRDLELDEQHCIDSRTFYDDADASVSDFIVTYRKTLSRLAKL